VVISSYNLIKEAFSDSEFCGRVGQKSGEVTGAKDSGKHLKYFGIRKSRFGKLFYVPTLNFRPAAFRKFNLDRTTSFRIEKFT